MDLLTRSLVIVISASLPFILLFSLVQGKVIQFPNSINNAIVALWNEADESQFGVLLLFIHWFVFIIVSSILLSIITERILTRRPDFRLPERLIYDPVAESFFFWCGNNDAVTLVDFKYRLEFSITFENKSILRQFLGSHSIHASIFSFLITTNNPATSLNSREGLLVSTITNNTVTPINFQNSKWGNPQNRQEVSLSINTFIYDDNNSRLFPIFEETEGILKSFRLFVYLTEADTGRQYIYTQKYGLSDCLCGCPATMTPKNLSEKPSDWTNQNRLNWTNATSILSEDFSKYANEEGRFKKNETHSGDFIQENKLFCEECKHNHGCPLKDQYTQLYASNVAYRTRR